PISSAARTDRSRDAIAPTATTSSASGAGRGPSKPPSDRMEPRAPTPRAVARRRDVGPPLAAGPRPPPRAHGHRARRGGLVSRTQTGIRASSEIFVAKPATQKSAISPSRVEDYAEWYQQVVRAADLAENSPVRGCMVIKPW